MKNPWPKFWIIGPLPWTPCWLLLPKDTDEPSEPIEHTSPDMSNVRVLFNPKPVANDFDNDPESA